MFDDHVPPQSSGTPPHNLPIADKAEDMFSGTGSLPPSPAPAPVQPPVPSAPSSTATPKSAISAGVLKPKAPLEDPLALDDAAPAPPVAAASPSLTPTPAPVQPPVPSAAPAPTAVPASASPEHAPLPPLSATVPPAVGAEGADTAHKLPANLYAIKEPKTGRFLFIAVVSFVGLIVFLLIVWWVYARFINPPTDPVIDTPTIPTQPLTDEQNNDPQPDANTLDSSLSGTQVDDTVLFGQPVDSDGDGLNDEREVTAGTDVDNWDSDNDLLSDGDELIIWNTDPLNPDSDGDGFPDGTEVKAGYSPTGPGRIFEPPTSPTPDSVDPAPVSESTTTQDLVPPTPTSTDAAAEEISVQTSTPVSDLPF